MAVLVTGGAGYIGSHTVWALVDKGESVVVLDRLSSGFAWAIPPAVKLVVGDVGDADLLDKVLEDEGIDAIIHFAGSIVVSESVKDPLAYYKNNTVNSHTLLSAALRRGIKHFVFSSTSAVYGDTDVDLVTEDEPLRPISPYGSSKLLTEIMLSDVANAHNFKYCALRYFNVAGADPGGRTGQSTPGATSLVKVAIETAMGRHAQIKVFGTDYNTPDGTAVRDYIHVSDLANAHILALDYLRAGGSSLVANCGYSKGYSVLEVLRAVETVTGRPLPKIYAPRRDGDSTRVVASSQRVRMTLGWQPQFENIIDIVTHSLLWERNLLNKEA